MYIVGYFLLAWSKVRNCNCQVVFCRGANMCALCNRLVQSSGFMEDFYICLLPESQVSAKLDFFFPTSLKLELYLLRVT